MSRRLCALLVVAGLWAPRVAHAVSVTMPDTTQTTHLSASTLAQVRVTVPAGVTISVHDVSAATASSALSVTVDNAAADVNKGLYIAIQADTSSFTPPVSGAVTWSAGDLSWNAATWFSGTGMSGTLSSSSYNTVANCPAYNCNVTDLVFTLAAKPSVKRSGNHTLSIRWQFYAP